MSARSSPAWRRLKPSRAMYASICARYCARRGARVVQGAQGWQVQAQVAYGA